jgi:exopolysaccharide biosynthesis polyprenyl glycosylphosphotransferase
MGRNTSVLSFKVQHAFFDFVLISGVLVAYFLVFVGTAVSRELFFPYSVVILLSWLCSIYYFGGYDYQRIAKLSHNFRLVLASCLVAMVISTVFTYLYPGSFNVLTLNISSLGFVSVFYILRLFFTRVVSNRMPVKNVLIYGAGWAGFELVDELRGRDYLKLNILGFIDDDSEKTGRVEKGIRVLGTHRQLKEIVEERKINLVIFAITNKREEHVFYTKSDLEEIDVDTAEMPDLFEKITGRVPVLHVNNTWHDFYVSLKHREPYWLYRIYNVFLAFFFTLIFLPILPFVALAIKLSSRGQILYKQKRVGKKEKTFILYKFRSMKMDAEENGAVWATENDPRLTKVGGFLRRTRLDEIPQLINVFRGEMNFVGPRPERPTFVKKLNKDIPFYRSRHQVAPGVTGWAQVQMGYANSVNGSLKKLQYDLYYVKNRNVFFDFLILLKTVHVVLTRQGT